MDFIRTIRSKKKKRYTQDGFNLDLSYITPRIIAMSFPAEGFPSLFRNPLPSVSNMLNTKHSFNYRIFNLSGIEYDYSKFGYNVEEYPWPDHYPPPIELLFEACRDMHAWLQSDPEHVAVVNCLAGKGRTGTLICCYLLYSGRFSNPEYALLYYKKKRFFKGGGVTQPSQVRYVHYFSEVLNGVRSPRILSLKEVEILTEKNCLIEKGRPYLELYKKENLVYSSKDANSDLEDTGGLRRVFRLDYELDLEGDFLCKIYNSGMFKDKRICRFSFNTAFIDEDCGLVLKKTELDPHKFKFCRNTSESFALTLRFEQRCKCKPTMNIQERCCICKSLEDSEQVWVWERISKILDCRNLEDSSTLLFGDKSLDDVDIVLFSPESESDTASEESV